MPFFSRNSETSPQPAPAPAPAPAAEEPRRFGLFHRRNSSSVGSNGDRRMSTSPSPSGRTTSTRRTSVSNGYGNGATPDRQASTATTGSRGSGGRNFLHKFNGGLGTSSLAEMDPSIVTARERVMAAEKAEIEADTALAAARARAREAREEVLKLEREAEAEAQRAKLKQYHAREVSKRGHKLGRHDL